MPDRRKDTRREQKQEEPARTTQDAAEDRATVSGESLGSGPQSPTHFGRDGDVLVEDERLAGRPHDGPRFSPPADQDAQDSAEQAGTTDRSERDSKKR